MDTDKTPLAQALCNLLNNAVKYSDRGSPVWLTVRREGNEAVVNVKDLLANALQSRRRGMMQRHVSSRNDPTGQADFHSLGACAASRPLRNGF